MIRKKNLEETEPAGEAEERNEEEVGVNEEIEVYLFVCIEANTEQNDRNDEKEEIYCTILRSKV